MAHFLVLASVSRAASEVAGRLVLLLQIVLALGDVHVYCRTYVADMTG